jgi:23S rRNA (adenine1618-N6)-methyltransferase
MSSEKSQQEKTRLHSRNKNRERYDLSAFMTSNPDFVNYVKPVSCQLIL